MESSRTGGLYLDQDIQITNEQPTTSGSRNKRGKGSGDQVAELRGCQIGKGACAKDNKLPFALNRILGPRPPASH